MWWWNDGGSKLAWELWSTFTGRSGYNEKRDQNTKRINFERKESDKRQKKKQIRQSFSKGVVSGSRSGNDKLVFEHYKKLFSIWGASANIEPLSFEISSGGLDNENHEFSSDLDVQEHNNNEHVANNHNESDGEPDEDTGNSLQTSTPGNTGKRKVGSSIVPSLINNKRKNLERNLLAAQKD